ncbi:MAG: XrtA system polysaccharide chain length determinant [Halieaceae bacterium]|jgi:polysaccharide chain length determinant protein (PEP-CTERM system associated)|nr:XrtA system polysaccharide chain length determinant [Halieaceae bacterium]
MQETLAQIFSYGLGVWRYRWLALVTAWLVAAAGWIYVGQMPESYVANARVFVDSNSVLRPLMRGLAITPNIDQRISLLSRTLLSRPNLEKLARMTDLDLQVTTEAEKDDLIKRLEESISLAGTRGNESLYYISVTDPDRDIARRIAQSLITVFIESSLNDKRQDSSGAQSFLEDQIASSERRLVEVESRLAAFKQRNVDVLPGEGSDYYGRLQAARADLNSAELQLRELENRRDELQRQIAGEEPVFLGGAGGGGAAPTSPLDGRIAALQAELDALLLRYTDKHPSARQLSGLIDELEAERDEMYAGKATSSGMASFGSLSSSPVYQGMRAMLAETEAQIAELNVRVGEFRKRVDALAGKVSVMPEVEAQLKQLTRDYSVISEQHQTLLQRRESARLSGDVESNAGDVSFRVIDPPFVPREPSEPNKLVLNAGVLVIAAGAGVALALLASLLNPLVNDARSLSLVAGLPLLGSVTEAKSNEQRRRDRLRLAGFGACAASLLVVFAGVLFAPDIIGQLI